MRRNVLNITASDVKDAKLTATVTIPAADVDAALTEALARLPTGEAASEVSQALDLPRKALYRRALELQGKG